MKYSIYKAFVMMVANIKIYLWIVIELALIVSILVLSEAIHRSANSEISRLANVYKNQEIYITYFDESTTTSIQNQNSLAGITYSDFMILQNELQQNVKLQYYIFDRITLYDKGVFNDIYIVWGSDNFLELQFDKRFKNEEGYIGGKAGELLMNNEIMVLSGSDGKEIQAIDPTSLTINDNCYRLEPLDVDYMIPATHINTELNSQYCIILPISERPADWGQRNVSTTLSVNFNDFSKAPEQMDKIISILIEEHDGKFKYRYNDVLNDYINRVEAILEETEIFSFIAKICLCVVIFGITGIMIIVIRKRKKEYAISYAIGASRINIYIELLAEVFWVSSAGSILGCIVGLLLINWQTQSMFEVQFYFSCVSVPLVVSLVIPLLTSFMIIPDVNAENPIETIKNE